MDRSDSLLTRVFPGLILLALGVFMLVVLIPMGIKAPGYVQPHSLSPQDLPIFLTWIVIGTGVLIILAGAYAGGQEAIPLGAISIIRAMAFCGAFAGFLVILPIIGISPATFIFVAALLLAKSRLKAWQSIFYAGLFTLAIRVVFIEIAGIPLPEALPSLF